MYYKSFHANLALKILFSMLHCLLTVLHQILRLHLEVMHKISSCDYIGKTHLMHASACHVCMCSLNDHDDRCILCWIGRPTFFPGPTIQTCEGPQGPGTMALNSGTVPAIRGPLRPM